MVFGALWTGAPAGVFIFPFPNEPSENAFSYTKLGHDDAAAAMAEPTKSKSRQQHE